MAHLGCNREDSNHLRKERFITNHSTISEFLLLEFSGVWDLQILCVILFLILYLAIVTGNLLIISAVAFDHRLHTPMYFFLMNLAILDVGSVSVIIPKAMVNSFMNTRNISYSGCVAQAFLFIFFLSSDFFLLTIMAYDRYVAICNPLRYEVVMNRQTCLEMMAGVWISSLLYGVLHTSSTFATPFCSNVVNQFFCEIPQLLKLACSDLYLIEMVVLALGVSLGLSCFIFIVETYVRIFAVVLRIPSVQGRRKAFSTCIPHLIIFSVFLVTGSFAYLKPTSTSPSHLDLAFTIIYSMLPPLMNPVIYSMRNQEIRVALSKFLGVRNSSQRRIIHF
ncbi:olfactory receptor 14C36-like [Tiliqua scincoides]|uniref:olfactory receptor 14C36-like n=1 Tax=Tiliqua scincoides TaxID=71010 RepID=UPI003462A4E8